MDSAAWGFFLQINKGKFSEEEATKIAQTYYGTNEAMMKKAKDLISVCSKKGKRNNNNNNNITGLEIAL